jgi:hypothetical protein
MPLRPTIPPAFDPSAILVIDGRVSASLGHVAVWPPAGVKFYTTQPRIERVRHAVDVGSLKSGIIQAKADRLLRKLVRIVDPRLLGMLEAVEPLFLARRHDLAVDEHCGRGFMINSIDSENVHPAPVSLALTNARLTCS